MALTRSSTLTDRPWIIAVPVGMLLAVCAAGLLRLPTVWAFVFTVALIVGVGSLLAKDFRSYWLAIFALALPLDIKKLLIDSAFVRQLAELHGVPLGELPGPVIYLSDLPLLVLLGQWMLELAARKRRVEFPRSHWFAVAYVVWSALSLAKAEVFSYALFDWVRTVKFYILYLYLANNVRTPDVLWTLIRFLVIGVALQGVICCYQFATQSTGHVFGDLFGAQDLYAEQTVDVFEEFFTVTPGSEFRRASGTVGPTNAQAQYFEFLVPMAFLLACVRLTFWRRTLALLALALGLAGLVVTFSRGGFIGITVGLITAVFLARRFRLITPWRFGGVMAVGLLVSVALAPKVYQFMVTRHEYTVARFDLYKVGAEMVWEAPILGVGLNNHIVQAARYNPEQYLFPMPTHNQYLLVASEVGIPGLVFLTVFLAAAMVDAWRAARTDQRIIAAVALGILSAFMAVGIHNLVDHLSYHTNLALLWVFAGLAPSLCFLGRPMTVGEGGSAERQDAVIALSTR